MLMNERLRKHGMESSGLDSPVLVEDSCMSALITFSIRG